MDVILYLKKAVNMYIHMIYVPLNRLLFRLNRVSYGKGLRVRGVVHIFRHSPKSTITIGSNAFINSARWATRIGCGDRTNLQLLGDGKLHIGDNCGFSNVAITCASAVDIGNNVLIGSGSKIFDTDFHSVEIKMINGQVLREQPEARPVVIEDNVFIGASVLILKGVHIGRNSVVGAGAVVTKSIPANEIWAGNPARCVKQLMGAGCESNDYHQ